MYAFIQYATVKRPSAFWALTVIVFFLLAPGWVAQAANPTLARWLAPLVLLLPYLAVHVAALTMGRFMILGAALLSFLVAVLARYEYGALVGLPQGNGVLFSAIFIVLATLMTGWEDAGILAGDVDPKLPKTKQVWSMSWKPGKRLEAAMQKR